MICGDVKIRTNQGEVIECDQSRTVVLPVAKNIEVLKANFTKILIIEKESAFFELTKSESKFCIKGNKFFEDFLILTSKGYPDFRIKSFIDSVLPNVSEIYYLGDYDVFGFDIFLSYAIGDWQYHGALQKINFLFINKML